MLLSTDRFQFFKRTVSEFVSGFPFRDSSGGCFDYLTRVFSDTGFFPSALRLGDVDGSFKVIYLEEDDHEELTLTLFCYDESIKVTRMVVELTDRSHTKNSGS